MKIFILTVLLYAVFANTSGQRMSPEVYWIQLKDKNGTNYSTDRPETFLSPDAIERRLKANIPVTEMDLPVSAIYTDSLLRLGVKIIGTSKWMNSVLIQNPDSLLLDAIATLSFVSEFDTAYSDFTAGGIQGTITNLPSEAENVESFFYGVASRQISLLGGNFLHNYGYDGEDIKIAVLDAGFYRVNEVPAFQSLWQENRILATRDFVNPGSDIFNQHPHGLSVLSTMAAYIPDTFVGTAPKALYMLLRSEEAARENKVEEAYWLLAAEFADSAGADIITSSLGYYEFPTSSLMNYTHQDLTGEQALVTRAAEIAFSRGMIVVASAGNQGNDDWRKITPPADGPNIIAVGSIDTAYQVTGFSSRGNTADGRIKPDVMAVGYRTKIINSSGNPGEGFGTSFSAPQIAGLIACLWQAAPDKSNREIVEAIRKSSSQYSNPDSISGYGIPNFLHALWDLKSNVKDISENEFIVYPNPFSAEFEIQSPNKNVRIQQVDIFQSNGKLVLSYKIDQRPGEAIRITGLQNQSPGIYYLIAKTEGEEIVAKLIRQ